MRGIINFISETTFWGLIVQCFFWLALFVQPIQTSMWIALFLITSDVVLGVWASIGIKKESFSSRAAWRTIGKIFIYEFLLVFALVLQKEVWTEHHLVKGVMTLISVVESISVLENVRIITGIDIWAFVFHGINRNSESGKFLFKLKNKSRKNNKKP